MDFARELSALVVRSPSGQAAAYPISESVQRNGICVETITPAPELDDDHAIAAQQLALRIAHELGVVGDAGCGADAASQTGPSWSTSLRCDRTTPATGRSMEPTRRSSRTICGAVLDLPLGDPASRQHGGP